MSSVAELTQQGHSARDPVRFRESARDVHGDDEVAGVTGGRQDAATLARLVHRSRVRLTRTNLRATTGLHPYLTTTVSLLTRWHTGIGANPSETLWGPWKW